MKTIIVSLGGSIINPKEIDIEHIKRIKKMVLDFSKENKIVIVCGGGHIAREYINAAIEISEPSKEDCDWVGIAATKLNAELIRTVFGKEAYEYVVYNPKEKIETDKKIIIASGWMPGCSSDNDAVYLAENLKADTVINLTNVDYVFDKDPKQFDDAKPMVKLSWSEFKEIVGGEWKPGLNLPFDPVAAKNAEECGLRVVIMNGDNINNLERYLKGVEFKGTTIE